MNSNTCMATTSLPMQPGSCTRTYNSHITKFFCKPKTSTSLNVRKFCVLSRLEQTPGKGPASKKHLISDQMNFTNLVPIFPKSPRFPKIVPKASKDVPYSFRYPQMMKKPRWFWRTLACIPYLMPLHETWMYAETAYHLHPFLEDFEFLTYPFLGFIGQLPSWFLMAYFFAAYLGVVRRKEWPHFLRFHVVMGMLLEIALQVVGTVSRWMPLAFYWGKLGMHLWTAIAFAYLFTVLECIRCALGGMYADVPFVCDAAYIQIPYD